MALVLNDRVKETSTSTGTGTINLGGAVDGFETFVAGIGNSNTTYYAIVHKTLNEFEIGIGTITDSSPDTITGRSNSNVLSSSNSDNVVNFSAGDKEVFCTQPAPKAVFKNENNDVVLADNQKSIFGDGEDLKIYSDGGGAVFETQGQTLDSWRFHKVNNGSVGAWVHFDHLTDSPSSVDFVSGMSFNHTDTVNNTTNNVALWQMNNLFTKFSQSNSGGTVVEYLVFDGQSANNIQCKQPLEANEGITVDNITIDGTEIDLSSGDLTIDVAGNISLDADDGGHVRFKDGGAEYFSIYEDASNNPILQASIADTNILFKGTDGSSVITALDLDIANAGAATFNSSITATTVVNVGTNNGYYLKQDSSKSTIRSESQPIVLQTFASSAWQDRLTVNNNGNVSIPGGAIAVGQSSFSGGGVLADFHASGSGVGSQVVFANDHNTNKFYVGLEGNTTGNALIYQSKDADVNFYTNNNLRMTLNNTGNLGIGTSSPAYKLHQHESTSGANYHLFTNSSTGSTTSDGLRVGIDSNEDGLMWLREGNNIKFGTGDTERMRIDGSGNVGIGTNAPARKFDVEGSTNDDWISRIYNTNTNGAGLLVRTDATSSNDKIALGVYADSAYKMVVKSTGYAGIGTTTPAYALDIEGNNFTKSSIRLTRTDSGQHNDPGLYFVNNAGANDDWGMGGIWFTNSTDGNAYGMIRCRTDDNTGTSGKLEFITGTSTVGNTTDPRLTIDSSGNVILNNGSPIYWGSSSSLGYIFSSSSGDTTIGSYDDLSLKSNWVRYYNGSSGNSGTTEYARISATGNWFSGPIGVNGGATNYGSSGQVLTSNGNAAPSWQTPSSGGYSANFTGYANAFSVGTSSTGGQGELRATGNIIAYYSDERLKDFHGKIENAVDKIKQLNGYYFSENDKAKEYGYENQDKKQIGVSAQEVEKVLPEIVSQAPFDIAEDGTSKSGEDYKTVDYEKLVPLLIEAIKEQQIQIDCLKEQLSGNN
tara:strand:- start:6361 stop:9327 length:2967 start_codon:yes stop_codon:yes gene_type:complete